MHNLLRTAILSALLVSIGGCEFQLARKDTADVYAKHICLWRDYVPVKAEVLPLTEFEIAEGETNGTLRAYVSLLDEWNAQTKAPGVFRFELYQYLSRSRDAKGKRLVIWPDYDLLDAANNSEYWKDFLRAYEFDLDLDRMTPGKYILQATYIFPGGKRVTAERQVQL